MGEGGLFTVAEAAARLSTSSDAIRKRIKRGRLEVVRANEGLRVRLTEADLSGLGRDGDWTEAGHGRDSGLPLARQDPGEGATVNALRESLRQLEEAARRDREALERELGRAERADAKAERAEARARQAEQEREAARIEAAAALGEGRALRERAERAEAERDNARAELESWTAGGPLARTLRALLFRRGRP